MRPIDKFILHIVHNTYPLNEISEKEIKNLIQKYQEEADDFNITISDEEVKRAILRFEELKNNPKIENKDLRTYSLRQLLRAVKSFPGMEDANNDYINQPDVVYNENNLVIYSGHNENNCVLYGRGERWCITISSFGTYRYDAKRKNPTFYLVKDLILPDSDPNSFIVVVVGSDDTYKVSDRTNNDVGGHQTEWERWEGWNFVAERFPRIANLRRIFKYIPLSNTEKSNKVWATNPISLNTWATELNFDEKKNYITIRKTKDTLFNNYSRENFIEKILPKYDKLSEWIAMNPWEIGFINVLKGFNYFKPQNQKSIAIKVNGADDPNLVDDEDIITEEIPFEAKVMILQLERIPNTNCFVTDKDKIIAYINWDDEIEISLITKEDVYHNIKISKRTQKYLFEFPKLGLIPIKLILDTIRDNNLDSFSFNDIIDRIKQNENDNSPKVVANINDEDLIFDFSGGNVNAYKILDNNIEEVTLHNESIVEYLKEEININTFLQNSLIASLLSIEIGTLDYTDLIKILKDSPLNNIAIKNNNNISLFVTDNGVYGFNSEKLAFKSEFNYDINEPEGLDANHLNNNTAEAYIQYLRINEILLSDSDLVKMFEDNKDTPYSSKIAFVSAEPPRMASSTKRLAIIGGIIWLVDTNNSDNSQKILPSGKLSRGRAPGITRTNLNDPTRSSSGRGRPSGTTNQPRTHINGEINIQEYLEDYNLNYNALNRMVSRRLSEEGNRRSIHRDRGASRRDNLLQNNGAVVSILESGRSDIYIINLNNNHYVASIVIQPGNSHFLLTSDDCIRLDSPSDLLSALRRTGEVNENGENNDIFKKLGKYLIFDYIHNHPDDKEEVKKILKDQINGSVNT